MASENSRSLPCLRPPLVFSQLFELAVQLLEVRLHLSNHQLRHIAVVSAGDDHGIQIALIAAAALRTSLTSSVVPTLG